MIDRINEVAVRTTQGSFVKDEDLTAIIEEYQGEGSMKQTGKYASFNDAKQAAMRDPELMGAFKGRSLKDSSGIGRSPTASEGVKP